MGQQALCTIQSYGTDKLCWEANNTVVLPKQRNSPAQLSFVLKVSLSYLRPRTIYSVPCAWIVQMAHCFQNRQIRPPYRGLWVKALIETPAVTGPRSKKSH